MGLRKDITSEHIEFGMPLKRLSEDVGLWWQYERIAQGKV